MWTAPSRSRHSRVVGVLVTLAILGATGVCACSSRPIRRTQAQPPSASQMAEFWRSPTQTGERDLFYGPGGPQLAPRPQVRYHVILRPQQGFSPKAEVQDPSGLEWSVKMGDEAQSEVTVSRLLWALGYHQPPIYFLPDWTPDDGRLRGTRGARFRPKLPWLRSEHPWSWQGNAFVGTPPYNGLLVLLMFFNSTDLKNENNSVYEFDAPRDQLMRWFVVRDLGASLGETGRGFPRRNWIEGFERQRFIIGVQRGYVRFDFHGRFHELVERLTPADVKWALRALERLTDKQWHDAFRAGGYTPDLTARYLARLRAKIAEARALPGGQ